MSENNSIEAVALGLMKMILSADSGYFIGKVSSEELKRAHFDLYQECLAEVNGESSSEEEAEGEDEDCIMSDAQN